MTKGKNPRKAAENVSYKDLCTFNEDDFSPDESEYEPDEDYETSEPDEDSGSSDIRPTKHNVLSEVTATPYNNIPNGNETDTQESQCVNNNINQTTPTLTNSQVSITSPTLTPKPLKIDRAKKKDNGKRQWDKKYMCKFCHKLYPKLPRHLEDIHQAEMEVAQYLSLPVGDKKRKKIIEKIRLDGEKIYNFSCFGSTDKECMIITKRRPTTEEDSRNYLPCEFCGSFLKKTYLSRHLRECSYRPGPSGNNADPEQQRHRNAGVQSRAALLLPTAPNVPQYFKENILEKMVYDDIYTVITGDSLIIEFGKKLFETKKKRPSQFREVKDRMRELARLLIAARNISDKVKSLTDLIDPTMYNIIVAATKEIAGYNNGNYDSPSLALKIGQSLKKCAAKYKGMCMDDEILHGNLRKIELFEQRINDNWSDDAAKDAHTTLHERQWNAPKRIPLTEDVKKMNNYLQTQENKLVEEFNLSAYRQLCENTLCRVILLNRRRVGEAQYMRLSDYRKATSNSQAGEKSEIMDTLSEVEKVLVKSLIRVEIRGKRGRMVPVILTPSMQQAITLLIDNRASVGVPPHNDFLFPAPHCSQGHYRADVLLRNVARGCGATNPSALTGTQLRKHVATMIQLLNLRENELDAVANYLGHDIRVHRQYYRLPHDTMQLAKISKLLINLENGNIHTMRGQNLDEINVHDVISDYDPAIEEDEDVGVESEKMRLVTEDPSMKQNMKRSRANKKQKFSIEDSNMIKSYFKRHIEEHRVPCQEDVVKIYNTHPQFKEINWKRVKYHVYNTFAGKRKT